MRKGAFNENRRLGEGEEPHTNAICPV